MKLLSSLLYGTIASVVATSRGMATMESLDIPGGLLAEGENVEGCANSTADESPWAKVCILPTSHVVQCPLNPNP